MSNLFFERPILNSPYESPARYWELDPDGQPTQQIITARRKAEYITPIPKPKKRRAGQGEIVFDEGKALSDEKQRYDPVPIINQLRQEVAEWRRLPQSSWGVTLETARLLNHWRTHQFSDVRPFFCQIEAVETAIWLTEVAPQFGKRGKLFLDHLANANNEANPGLNRLALKLATGAGKTTVMAMLIAWQTVNAARSQSQKFSRGFLIVTPGITIKDRLNVLKPNDANAYYGSRQLVPPDMLREVNSAKVVITNYHAFKHRELLDLSKGGRSLLRGRGEELSTAETDGQMIQRALGDLMGMKNILVLNDEAHHCYRERPPTEAEEEEEDLSGEEKEEAEANNVAARLWISGLEAVKASQGVSRIMDLSATPFFLHGSGYREGTLFHWTMSDFSLMDAIESGIVKLPRVPIADNIPGGEVPMFRYLWDHIRADMPKKRRGNAGDLNPLDLPNKLKTALEALYGHYEKTFNLWRDAGIAAPPCFIVVCQNTAISKLVYDYISGFVQQTPEGERNKPGRLPLFSNFDDNGDPYARPRTLLIDSAQLESGEGLDDRFKKLAAPQIERLRREILERGGKEAEELKRGKDLDDVTLLRGVMNTVGKRGQLGESIRCVVSVSMLTEGWDANTVTHVLGVRAFGTQLLCEQVIGRALRRQSYDLNEDGLFPVEYADVLGIPFDFTAKPVVAERATPRETINVKAVRPDRDGLEIRFPRVQGYRVELPPEKLSAVFTDDSKLTLTPDMIGATKTRNAGIIGEQVDLDLAHTKDMRFTTILYELVTHLMQTRFQDANGDVKTTLFPDLKRITRQWLEGGFFFCTGGTYPAQVKYREIAEMACERIYAGIARHVGDKGKITVVPDPYNPVGSTAHVNFNTSKITRWQTDSRRCHVNWVIWDSNWEAEFCRVVEGHPRVRAYVKNHNLGFDVPYRFGGEAHVYRPDFIVLVDDGHGDADLLHLVVEIKGYRREEAKEKKATMENYWVPGVNNAKKHGRWAFAEFTEVYEIEADFEARVEAEFNKLIESTVGSPHLAKAS